jgi:hypothetical protein
MHRDELAELLQDGDGGYLTDAVVEFVAQWLVSKFMYGLSSKGLAASWREEMGDASDLSDCADAGCQRTGAAARLGGGGLM